MKGYVKMNVSSLLKGVAVGMVMGAATYAVTNASRSQKKQFKTNTVKAVKSVSKMMDGLGSMFC